MVKSIKVAALALSANDPEEPNAKVLVLLLLELRLLAVNVKLFRSRVPAVRVTSLVLPIVRAPASCVVAAGQFMVMGKSNVRPLVVIVLVPDVATKVRALVPAVKVPPVFGTVKLPYNKVTALLRVKVMPVKLRSLK